MSKFLHEDTDADDDTAIDNDRAMTKPRPFFENRRSKLAKILILRMYFCRVICINSLESIKL